MARIARTLPALAVLLSACAAAAPPGQQVTSAMTPHASAKDPTTATGFARSLKKRPNCSTTYNLMTVPLFCPCSPAKRSMSC